MVDRQNLPRPAPEVSEDGVPATEEIPEEILLTGDPVEGDMPPLDRPQAVKDWGTTTSEHLGQEPLDVRVAREVPDVGMAESEYTDRQLLEPGADAALGDDEADSIGEADVGLEDTLSAEEAAVQVVDEPPGMNYDPDPGYVDYEEEKA
ncbi:MAG TPA: hypothetical protein VHF27_09930 [Acidimicrobiales bacterium]|nr:hypothetical protein [Acidimicrobiales bacterium]